MAITVYETSWRVIAPTFSPPSQVLSRMCLIPGALDTSFLMRPVTPDCTGRETLEMFLPLRDFNRPQKI